MEREGDEELPPLVTQPFPTVMTSATAAGIPPHPLLHHVPNGALRAGVLVTHHVSPPFNIVLRGLYTGQLTTPLAFVALPPHARGAYKRHRTPLCVDIRDNPGSLHFLASPDALSQSKAAACTVCNHSADPVSTVLARVRFLGNANFPGLNGLLLIDPAGAAHSTVACALQAVASFYAKVPAPVVPTFSLCHKDQYPALIHPRPQAYCTLCYLHNLQSVKTIRPPPKKKNRETTPEFRSLTPLLPEYPY